MAKQLWSFYKDFNGPSLRFGLLFLNVYLSEQMEQVSVCCVFFNLHSFIRIQRKSTVYDRTHTCELKFVRPLVSPALTRKLQRLEVRYRSFSRTCVGDNHRPYVLHSAIMGCIFLASATQRSAENTSLWTCGAESTVGTACL